MKDKTVWVLKTISKDKTSYNGKFKWNTKKGAINTAKDYKRTKKCGRGLHGALKGEGDGGLFSWNADALWLVLEVKNDKDLIQLDGKVKFKTCKMIYAGTREKATEMIYKKYHTAVIGGTSTSGDKGTSTSGKDGIIQIKFWDSKKDRHRFKTGYIGEEGLKPNVKYKLDENNEFEEVEL